MGCYRTTLGGIQEIEFLCTKVDFGHVGIVQKRKTDNKNACLRPKNAQAADECESYHFIVTNCC